ncbi:DUF2262 domain-containing protein [Lignipirellula cremea]|uniref:DUF2262 domain-containing protein n=1 Tax=Lignipirellula cremea TaxID=2528010 RepID=A0A518DZ93_9BACT|nr:DUF2262 domain-containing protein [Lignipirellula cremea]QDU97154.1 hypothetical protein Pla8534_49990 [Lignipirellula cremea]
MTSTFKPPSLDRLAEVDTSDCEYKDGVVEIEGVISPAGLAGWPHSDDYEVHCFHLSAWRYPGQPVVNKKLTILRPAARDADWSGEYPALSIQRIRVLVSTEETRAICAGKAAQKVDAAGLSEVAEELAKPVVIQTERFGELTLDRSIDWFTGKVIWNGETVELSFNADENLSIATGLEVAGKLWDEQTSWKQKVDDYAVQDLLSAKNDGWLLDDEAPLTPDQFKARMTLQSISIDIDGDFEFWHDDGELFWGHSILIQGSLKEGITQADIPG